jgi:hypothetical protein
MPALRRGNLASPPGALIVGGAHVSTAIARSLGRHGIPVWLMANHPLPTYSRYVKRSFPWPGADHADGLTSIIDVAEQHGLHGWVLIATGDQDMRMIAQNRALLSQYFCVASPDWDTAQWAYDKRLTYSRAAELAIDFPASFRAGGLDEIERLDCRFPVILKPAFRKSMDEFTQAKAWKRRTTAINCWRSTSAPPHWSVARPSLCRNGSPAPANRNIPTPACGSAANPLPPWLPGAAGNIQSISAARAPTWKPSSKTKSKLWPAAC